MKRIYHFTLLLVTLPLLCAVAQAQNPDGDSIGRGDEIHDQRAGSMLIYNYYTSGESADTRITLTNTSETSSVYLSLYFVNGATGEVLPGWFYLDPTQTLSFLVSEYDPNTTGYIIAIASDYEASPLQFDYLIGKAAIALASGHQATLGALAVPIKPGNFGNSYAAAPRKLAVDQIPSPSDGVKQMLVVNRIDGSLINGMPGIGALECDLFNQYGARFTFVSRSFGPQTRTFFYDLADTETTSNNLYNFLPSGEYGWLRLRPTESGAITGAVLYFRETEGTITPSPG
jgi:hypothetical protein